MEEKQNKIENEIFEKIKGLVKNIDLEESRKTIEAEIKNRNYLPEEWQIEYAIQRIVEKIEEDQRKQRLSRADKSGEQVIIKKFINKLEADLAVKILEKNGIKSVLDSGINMYGISMASIPGITMFILKKDFEKAKDLLA